MAAAAVFTGGVGEDGLVVTIVTLLVLLERVWSRDLLCSSSSLDGDNALDGAVSQPEINAFHSLGDRRSCADLRLASAVCILAWC
jgi:hypothetical protein